jgi:hypothetical protein
VGRHEVDLLGRGHLGGHDEVALVLAVLVVDEHEHPARCGRPSMISSMEETASDQSRSTGPGTWKEEVSKVIGGGPLGRGGPGRRITEGARMARAGAWPGWGAKSRAPVTTPASRAASHHARSASVSATRSTPSGGSVPSRARRRARVADHPSTEEGARWAASRGARASTRAGSSGGCTAARRWASMAARRTAAVLSERVRGTQEPQRVGREQERHEVAPRGRTHPRVGAVVEAERPGAGHAQSHDLDRERGQERRAGLSPAMRPPGRALVHGGAVVVADAAHANSWSRAT